jgi:hypothetical protein
MMKKIMIALMTMLTIAASGKAMSYEQARNEALFLTDKMAYELNLTDEQYEAAYEINLDYLMGVTSYDDVFGTYWERRNLDMSYILLDWQWNSFIAASYFYRPLYWRDGFWHFGIYARYPHRDYFYFGRPVFYASYRGGHAWHVVGGHGFYYGRREHFRPAAGRAHFGMHDRWQRGDFHHVGNHSRLSPNQNRGHYGGIRTSSTRTTVHQDRSIGSHTHTGSGHFGNGGSGNGGSGNGHFGGNRGTHSGSFGSNRGTHSGSFGHSSHNSGVHSGHSSSGSFSNSRPTGSFGGRSSGGSFGGSRSSSASGSSHSSGGHSGGHFGGSRR